MPLNSYSAEDLFDVLMRQSAEMLAAFLHSAIDDTSAVDDLFQETMLTAWRRLDDYDRSLPFGPWLRGIASKLVLAHLRKRQRIPMLMEPVLLDQIDHQIGRLMARTGDTLEEKLYELKDCVQRLPAHYRVAIQSRYFEQIGGRDLANRLEITVDSVAKRLRRARLLLRDCLFRKAVFQSEGAT